MSTADEPKAGPAAAPEAVAAEATPEANLLDEILKANRVRDPSPSCASTTPTWWGSSSRTSCRAR